MTHAFEEVEDVRRVVVEAIREVLVAAGPVHVRTAIGADAATDERPRCRRHLGALPRLQRDAALVLLPGPMLWEEARQVAVINPEHDGRAGVRDPPSHAV